MKNQETNFYLINFSLDNMITLEDNNFIEISPLIESHFDENKLSTIVCLNNNKNFYFNIDANCLNNIVQQIEIIHNRNIATKTISEILSLCMK